MGSISDHLENELLDHIFNAAYVPPATVYIGLSTADPLDDASGLAEPVGNGYARVAISFGAAAARTITQNADAVFAVATGAWGLLTHWALFDAPAAGNMMAHGELDPAKNVVAGNTVTVPSGEVYIEFVAGEISNYLSVALLDLAFRNQAYAVPDTYIALVTAAIVDADTGATITEPAGGAYARVQVTPNGGAAPDWNVAAAGVVDNSDDVDFVQATGAWGTIVAVAVCDSGVTGAGNLLMYDNTMADQAVTAGDEWTFPAGDLDMQMS